jgi:hypothetical protein
MDFPVGLNSIPRDTKKYAIQEGTCNYLSVTLAVKRYNKTSEKKKASTSKQKELINEDGLDANSRLSNISSEVCLSLRRQLCSHYAGTILIKEQYRYM